MTRLIPQHEQHYPTKLLPHRLEEYVFDDGRPPTQNRAYATRLTGQLVLDVITRAQAELGLTNIDPRYFVGTCFHESGCTNEWDTEVATASCVTGFMSVGAFQIGEEEAKRFGFMLDDMLELDKACRCMVQLAEANRTGLRTAAQLGDLPDLDYTDAKGALWRAGTMRAYLAIAHNHGLGYAQRTITAYGMDWAKYQARNPTDNIVAHGYGEDCVTGGANWPTPDQRPIAPGSRVLALTHPYMTGEDVRELQRHLKVLPVDGVYGPMTADAVGNFQLASGITPIDKVCGPVTWRYLGITI